MLKNIIRQMTGKFIHPLVLKMLSIMTLLVVNNAASDIAIYEKWKEDLKKEIELKALEEQSN